MPIIKSAKKAARQATKRRSNNEAIKKTIRTALKDFKNKPTNEKMAKVQSEYDKAVKKGLMKKATASRRKAKCDALVKAIHDKGYTMDIKTAQVDADDVEQLKALFNDYKPELVVNLALPYQDLTIMDACLACG